MQQDSSFLPVSVAVFDRTVPSCLCLRNPVAVFVHVYFPVKVSFTFLSTTIKYTCTGQIHSNRISESDRKDLSMLW